MEQRRWKITFLFTAMVFLVLLFTAFIIGSIYFFMDTQGAFRFSKTMPMLILLISSVIIGTIFSRILGRNTFKLVNKFTKATSEIAKGNFDIRIPEDSHAVELQEVAKSFNYMASELSHNEMMKNDFIENVSHEYKTPLSAIEGYATLLQTPNLSEEKKKEYTSKIISNTKRMNSLVSNILLLTRLQDEDIEISKETFSLDEQIRETILMFEQEWTERNINIEVDLDDAMIYGNKALLGEVWQNLLNNAFKFVQEDRGEIHVMLHIVDGMIQVTVSDNGIGMTQEELEHMFDKFYQADKSRTTIGNGLGLSLVKRIINLHNGTIDAESEKGKGTRFLVSLPSYEIK